MIDRKLTLMPSYGTTITNLPSSSIRYVLSISITRRSASSSFKPAFWSSSQNTFAEPSATGGSSASISIKQLSSPDICIALIRCSIVNIFIPLSSIVVARRVDVTLAAVARTLGLSSRSVLSKTIPVSAPAGSSLICTILPECRPTPSYETTSLNVVCSNSHPSLL